MRDLRGDAAFHHAVHHGRHARAGDEAPWRQPAAAPAHPLAFPAGPPTQQGKPWVPVKDWRTCEEISVNMLALPPGRLDQKLLSATLQHMVTVSSRWPCRPGTLADQRPPTHNMRVCHMTRCLPSCT